MITFKEYISESINDKGILKALFIVGIPGAGKSYTTGQLKGTISPKVVNTDKATEFLSKKFNIESNSTTWRTFFRDKTRPLTTNSLANYLNSMLPLFVDGTSNDVSNILGRAGILESIGYDVGMVFIDTDLSVALDRAKKRGDEIGRQVDADFIAKVHELSVENRKYFQNKFDFFRVVSNNPGELDDAAIAKIFNEAQSFYSKPLENPVGIRTLAKLREAKESYLIPSVFEKDDLAKKVSGWYRS